MFLGLRNEYEILDNKRDSEGETIDSGKIRLYLLIIMIIKMFVCITHTQEVKAETKTYSYNKINFDEKKDTI